MKLASVQSKMSPKISLLVAIAAILGATSAQALPVIPGAAGFGMDTPAGRGGTVYKVTNLNASGTGSLQACIDGKTARVCVFEVSGVIRITKDMVIWNDKITIAGQTAPSPGIMIRGAALNIHASDVLVQHIRVRAGDDLNGPNPDNRDALKIEGTAAKALKNIVIDHCSFSWSIDEMASTWGPHDNITFSNNIFAEPLHDSLHPNDDGSGTEKHGFGVLFGPADGSSITMVGNLLAHQTERNPLSRAAELVMVNNLVYDRSNYDTDLQSQDGRLTKNAIVGNVYMNGPSNLRTVHPVNVRTTGPYRLYVGSRVHVSGNDSADYGNALMQMVSLQGGDVLASLLQSAVIPVWNTGLPARSTANNAVYERVLKFAGARPADRDTVDKKIIGHVRNRSGQTINCVAPNGTTRCNKNAGGWPVYAQHTRRLTLPANPNSVASNGYTNLENWLHQMDETVAGVVQASSPTSPPALSVR